MLQRLLGFILVIFLVACCETISPNTSAAKNIQVFDTVIDYTSVDVYPLFSNCNDIEDKTAQKECFENMLTKRLSNSLQRIHYQVKKTVNDSSYVNLLINSNGKTKVVSIDSPQNIRENLPQLDSIIKQSVNELPIVKPALKRGIPVKSQYKLAIIVRTN